MSLRRAQALEGAEKSFGVAAWPQRPDGFDRHVSAIRRLRIARSKPMDAEARASDGMISASHAQQPSGTEAQVSVSFAYVVLVVELDWEPCGNAVVSMRCRLGCSLFGVEVRARH